METFDPSSLPKEVLDVVEADSFWCLTKLLDGIQDNYIHTQPGIQRQVTALRDLVQRIDVGLTKHLSEQGVEFIQFSFRWMNCMLMREVSVKNTIRMWDTYMVDPPAHAPSQKYPILTILTGGRTIRVFRVSPLCLRSISSQMVGPTSKDGFSGDFV